MLKRVFKDFKEFHLVPIRIGLSWVFIAHGGQKLLGLWGGAGLKGFAASLSTLGLRPALFWAILAACAEFFGGWMVLLGFYARFGALLILTVMVVAIVTVHGSNGFFLSNQGYEYNMVLIAVATSLLFHGPGKFSINDE